MPDRPGSGCYNQLTVKRRRDPPRDIVLYAKQIGRGAIAPLCPQMRGGLGIDQLSVDADPAA